MADYEMANLAEIRTIEDHARPAEDDSKRWHQIRYHFGISAFGVNAFTADRGLLINEHEESDDGQEELYIVLTGHATFMLDGEERDAPAGTFLYVKPGVRRSATAQAPSTTVVVLGAKPGHPYEVMNWELFAQAFQLHGAGRHDEAADAALPVAEAHPTPLSLYNLACMESMAGRRADALEHLRAAIGPSEESEMSQGTVAWRARLRKLADEDTDLDPIREDPGFGELLGRSDG
jgi:quercetin dioxygenase-like cupin family protein